LRWFFLRFAFTRKRTSICEEGGAVHEVVERILKASIEEFAEKGYAAASTNSIAKKAKVAKGLLFHYFKSKENLYIECYKHVLSWSKKKFEEFAKQVKKTRTFSNSSRNGLAEDHSGNRESRLFEVPPHSNESSSKASRDSTEHDQGSFRGFIRDFA
jgi:AcrR family transcriptional regulator